MANSNVLDEFLSVVGFKVDEVSFKRSLEAIDKVAKGLEVIAGVATGATLAITASLAKAAEGFDKLFFATQRTGSSAKDIRALQFAFGQMGSSADEAMQSVEGLAAKIRSNPGFKSLVAGMGGDVNHGTARMVASLSKHFSSVSTTRGEAERQMLGLPENAYLALQKGNAFDKKLGEGYKALDNLDLDKAAADGNELSKSLNALGNTFDILKDKTTSPLFKDLQPQIEKLNNFLKDHQDDIAKACVKIGDALFKMFDWVVEHIPDLDSLADTMGGWEKVFSALALVISALFVGRVLSLFGALRGLAALAMPPWVLALLGLGAGAVAGAAWLHERAPGTPGGDASQPSYGDAKHNQETGGWWGGVKRWWGKNAPGYLGGVGAANPTAGGTVVDQALPPEAKALLDTISSGEAHGYNVVNGGSTFQDYSRHPYAGMSTYAGGRAAGRYQDLPSTWAAIQRETGIKDFSPASQDRGNWYLAQRDYKARTGRDLFSDLRSKDPARIAAVGAALRSTWTSLNSSFGSKYHSYLGRAPVKLAPMLKAIPRPGDAGYVPPMPPIQPLPSVAPLGVHGSNDNSKSVIINDHSKTEVHGVNDPTKAADHVGSADDRRQSILLRNLQSAIG